MKYKSEEIKNNITKGVEEIFNIYKNNNSKIYLVGGAIRNSLVGTKVNDFDFASPLTPEESSKLLKRNGYKVIPTGIKFGTITAIKDEEEFEITTYRIDSSITDGRKPEEVFFTSSLKEDLLRRDFTINAMAWSPDEGFIDYFCGLKDLFNKKIVAVGDPNERFKEDALRILRGVRFMTRYNFEIEKETLESMKSNIHLIDDLSGERIKEELKEILLSNNVEKGLNTLMDIGFFKVFMSEINDMYNYNQNSSYHHLDLWGHTVSVVNLSPKHFETRLAALMHDTGKPFTRTIDKGGQASYKGHADKSAELVDKLSEKLKLSNEEKKLTKNLVKRHMLSPDIGLKGVNRLINTIGLENIQNYIGLLTADRISSHPNFRSLEDVNNLEYLIQELLVKDYALTVKDLKINGLDLMDIGYRQGVEIGKTLNECLDIVIEEPFLNKKSILLDIAKLLKEGRFDKSNYLSKENISKLILEDIDSMSLDKEKQENKKLILKILNNDCKEDIELAHLELTKSLKGYLSGKYSVRLESQEGRLYILNMISLIEKKEESLKLKNYK